jgi:hypothetical protein
MKILVAEDDMVSRGVLQAALVKWVREMIVARDDTISRRLLKA